MSEAEARGEAPQGCRIDAAVLRAFAARALEACELPEEDAATVAALMVEADLTGADAHGIFRLPQYVARLRAGGMNPLPRIAVERAAPAVALVDGDNGMGHLVMRHAAATAIELARENGIGWVGARRSNHAGPAALYAAMPMREGMVGLYSAVASANHMAPWGGSDALLGTNPLAVAIPAGMEPDVVLDIATTVVSYGTVKNHALQGRALPEGWMVERATGLALTDPTRSGEGVLLPIGGHKGSGLALVLGLLAGVLNGAAFGRDVVDFNADQTTETNTGHFIIALDIRRFVAPDRFKAEVDRHLRDLRSSTPLPGTVIRLPGEQRAARHAERSKEGVLVGANLRARLDVMAREIGIAPLAADG